MAHKIITISLPEEMVDKIDSMADSDKRTRSNEIHILLERAMERMARKAAK